MICYDFLNATGLEQNATKLIFPDIDGFNPGQAYNFREMMVPGDE